MPTRLEQRLSTAVEELKERHRELVAALWVAPAEEGGRRRRDGLNG